MWGRVLALIVKELLSTLKDRKSRVVLIGLPLVQLLVFPHAAVFEVTGLRLMVFNEDRGQASREVVSAFAVSESFVFAGHVTGETALREAIVTGRADLVLRIDADFSADLASGRTARLQAVVDGRNSNTALIAASYAGRIAAREGVALAPASATPVPAAPEVRAFHNPNLRSQWFILPGLVGVLALVVTLAVTAFSIAREKEIGTYDQLLVTPLRPHEIALGKTAPAILIGFSEGAVFSAVASLAYGVPLIGELWMLGLGLLVFLLAVVGVGLAISTLAATQQQALFGGFLFVTPAVILSGFATPIENMPAPIQTLTFANPLRYFLVIARGVFLKDIPPELFWSQLLPMLAIAALTLVGASALTTRRHGA
ncbi:MAG: ABC transporter permease [Pseudomonadota bacterium]